MEDKLCGYKNIVLGKCSNCADKWPHKGSVIKRISLFPKGNIKNDNIAWLPVYGAESYFGTHTTALYMALHNEILNFPVNQRTCLKSRHPMQREGEHAAWKSLARRHSEAPWWPESYETCIERMKPISWTLLVVFFFFNFSDLIGSRGLCRVVRSLNFHHLLVTISLLFASFASFRLVLSKMQAVWYKHVEASYSMDYRLPIMSVPKCKHTSPIVCFEDQTKMRTKKNGCGSAYERYAHCVVHIALSPLIFAVGRRDYWCSYLGISGYGNLWFFLPITSKNCWAGGQC